MATWNDLRNYIRSNYKIAEEHPDRMFLDFNIDSGRTQRVAVRYSTNNVGEEWVRVESGIGEFGTIDLEAAIRATDGLLVGGISAIGNLITFADAFPLLNLDVNEFESPLHKVLSSADHLERQLTDGVDQY
jgi:hypothetical protein